MTRRRAWTSASAVLGAFAPGHPSAWREAVVERLGRHRPDPDLVSHLVAAVDWLARAQDATPTGGIARGYAVAWNPYFKLRGWEPEYPETTGYIIPTLYAAAAALGRPDLAARAQCAADWECDVQLADGAVQGGVIGQPADGAVFNTGQVIFGWLAAHAMTGSGRYADAAIRAGRFLSRCQDRDGIWRRGTSSYAARGELLYNARTAWALAEAGVRLGLPGALRTARRALEAVALRQHPNGWIPECSLDDPAHPLLHTLAYAIRGLLEGGRVLGDDSLIAHAERAAAAVAAQLRADGFLAGRFAADWAPAVTWSCLTGNAQMANVWFRLSAITGDARWIEPARRTLRFVAATQNRTSGDGGLRGGIKGSAPMSGAYGRYETLSWATKFFVDAILRDEQSRGRLPVACAAADLA